MNFKKIKIYTIIIFIFTSIILLVSFISGYFSLRVRYYMNQKVIINSNILFEQSLRKAVIPNINTDSLIKLSYGENNRIENVIINTKDINTIMSEVINVLESNIKDIEEKKELNHLNLPLGTILSDTLFPSLGPKINISIRPVSSFKVDIITTAEPFGINNSLLQVLLVAKVDVLVLIPFSKEIITIDVKIPLAIEMVNGEVPRYYYYLHNYDVGPSIPEIE